MYVFYPWYDHLIRRTEDGQKIMKEIKRCLDEHDFEKFMRLRDVLNSNEEDMKFLPDYGWAYDGPDDYDPKMIDITVKENFDLITEHQYECG